MAVPSTGSYGVDKDLVYSYPVICKDGKYEIVEGLKNSKASQARMEDTRKELIGERDAVAELLK